MNRPLEIQKLTSQLNNSDAEIREEAVFNLAKIGSKDVIELLLACVDDPVPAVRETAIYGLGKIQSEEAIPVLVDCLKDLNFETRWVTVEALEKIGSQPVIEPLITCLTKDPQRNVRASAAKALGKLALKNSDEKAMVTLLRCLADEDENDELVRHEAAYAISQLNSINLQALHLNSGESTTNTVSPEQIFKSETIERVYRLCSDLDSQNFLHQLQNIVQNNTTRGNIRYRVQKLIFDLAGLSDTKSTLAVRGGEVPKDEMKEIKNEVRDLADEVIEQYLDFIQKE